MGKDVGEEEYQGGAWPHSSNLQQIPRYTALKAVTVRDISVTLRKVA
jgi:hypothetical protein